MLQPISTEDMVTVLQDRMSQLSMSAVGEEVAGATFNADQGPNFDAASSAPTETLGTRVLPQLQDNAAEMTAPTPDMGPA